MAEAVLVTGFGPFLDVSDNPSGRLARLVDGLSPAPGVEVHGLELPVSFARAPRLTLEAISRLRPWLVIGTGVATLRSDVAVESLGRRRPLSARPDVDGIVLDDLDVDGPEHLRATADVSRLAVALGAVESEDAGGYVCNAWLYRVLRGLQELGPGRRPEVVFIHVPPSGLSPEALCRGIKALWSERSNGANQIPTPS